MKKGAAFSLVELLVVIAIIAVLAAILFPVFERSKIQSQLTKALSCQKQISLALVMYINDSDDRYPRQDSCVPNSSLNPDLNGAPYPPGGIGINCTIVNYRYRHNHFSWQKYLVPFAKSKAIFETPLRVKDKQTWKTHGEIASSFALNIGLIGAHDTLESSQKLRANRFPAIGGTYSAFETPSQTAILLEMPGINLPMVPSMSVDSGPVGRDIVVYPLAVREFWRYKLLQGSVQECMVREKGLLCDSHKIPSGGIVIGFVDGSVRHIRAAQFLERTPSKREILQSTGASYTSGWTYGNDCTNPWSSSTPTGNFGAYQINPDLDYPLWGLRPKL